MENKEEIKMTPFLRQYFTAKEKYTDCVIFFRLGDFYEMFYEDAVEVSKILDLTLTQRGGVPMCGVPHHSSMTYISKLVNKGYKVALCEQLSEATKGGKMIERDVVRVITAGTVNDELMLEENKNNYILNIYKNDEVLSLCYCDITTGEFAVQEIKEDFESSLSDTLARIAPTEVLGNKDAGILYKSLPMQNLGILPRFNEYYDWAYGKEQTDKNLKEQFGENYKVVFEITKNMQIVCGSLIEYLNETQKRLMSNINKISKIVNSDFLLLDATARRNLELVETIRDRKRYGSLLWLLDATKTSMGARKLRKMFDEPLRSSTKINRRLNAVEELVKKIITRDKLQELLSTVNDIERLSGKIAYGSVMPKDLISLRKSFVALPEIKQELKKCDSFAELETSIDDFAELKDLLFKAINENAPHTLKDGGFINKGFNSQLDEFRSAKENGKKWLETLAQREREKTGIENLKIDYNRVYGYYVEINKKFEDRVPLYYQRKQTVSNNERYIFEELKEVEDKILGSEEKAVKLEMQLFGMLREHLVQYVEKLQATASAIAEVDAILSLAITAVKNNYVKPTINSSVKKIEIVGGRHPVVEAFMKNGTFVSNDTMLDEGLNRTMIITGPNMAGKSTYMRQVALITFMAHIGSFVPAKSAEIAITDRIFTRVGASDDVAFGQSTFMVEMSEVASILSNATEKSLVILDEIGRGTSTFDGLSIAWSVVEYICNKIKAKTLFATHYHELTELEGNLDGVKNYKISVKEIDDEVIFLRKIIRGGANKSFGIQVARLAGLPKEVLSRAKVISKNLEANNEKLDYNIFNENKEKAENNSKLAQQMLEVIKDIDVNRLSPMAAFDILVDLTRQANGGEE